MSLTPYRTVHGGGKWRVELHAALVEIGALTSDVGRDAPFFASITIQ